MAGFIEITQLSPTMTEGVLVEWIKKTGDKVEPGDVIASVETDKAVMDLEAFEEGIILATVAEPGTRLPVGAPIGILGEEGEDISSMIEEAQSKLSAPLSTSASTESNATPESSAKAETTPAPQPPPAKEEKAAEPAPPAEKPKAATPPQPVASSALSQTPDAGGIKSSPLARRLAATYGVPLAQVKGSGPNGRIVKRDVEQAREELSRKIPAGRQAQGGAPLGARAEDTKEQLSMMRQVIAERLSESKSTVPHFYITRSAEITQLLKTRSGLNASLGAYLESGGEQPVPKKVSVNDFVVRASALALREHPEVNASWGGDHIVFHGNIDISIAVAIEDGLLTPVVRNADQKSLLNTSEEVKSLAKRARERKLQPEEFTNGTFSISNLGMYGIDDFQAIINPPEAAILAVGASRKEPKWDEAKKEFVPVDVVKLTLSCDHRVVDGAKAAEFMTSLAFFLEHPELLH